MISACGGGTSSPDAGQNLTSTAAPKEQSTPYRLRSTEELLNRLPTPRTSLNGMVDEGLWLIEVSTESKFISEEAENSYDITYYDQGTQVAVVYEQDGEFYTALCATPLEANLGSDAPLSIDGNRITYEYSRNEIGLSRYADIALSIELNPQHLSFQGRVEHDLLYDDGQEVFYTTNLAGIKLSNSSTFTDAMSAFDIDFKLKVNSAESNITDLGNSVTCMGASVGVGTGTTEKGELKYSGKYGAALTRTDNSVDFYYWDKSEGDIEESQYAFNQSIIKGQGDPYADGICDGCTPSKAGAFSFDLKPESAELSATGSGTDADDETIEWSFSFSEL